ncbi:MAG: hypothetical protein ACREJ3_17035, partial [Polyangiaceae bacterium]
MRETLAYLARAIHSDAHHGCYDRAVSHRGLAGAGSTLTKMLLACAAGCAGTPTTYAASPGAPPSVPAFAMSPQTSSDPPGGGLRTRGLGGSEDPTVWGARILPESLYGSREWGADPGGGVRAGVAGVRFVASIDGGIVAALQRLPASPSAVIALPERLGGGFILAIQSRLWRAETWLGQARPIYTSPFPIGGLCVGLDRLYVRSPRGLLASLDPRTGATLDLGPLPPSPHVAGLIALDAWHEMALLDFRGALVTADAGSSWQKVPLPVEPTGVSALGGAFVVEGIDPRHRVRSWQVSPDGQEIWPVEAPSRAPAVMVRPASDKAARIFGPLPIVSALEDGWPLSDRSALVARDGTLARIRLSDGVIVEMTADAFPLTSARCHAISLAREHHPGAFGFVCGEPRGKTIIYAWDPSGARLRELRRFDDPREVLGFGNGALAARGDCDSRARSAATEPPMTAGKQAWCVRLASGAWREVWIRDDADRPARLVVLSDEREATVRPPIGGDLATASLTIADGTRSTSMALRLPSLDPQAMRALRWGIWMDGFEERRPGVLSGWVAAGESLLGIEVALNGEVRVGELIRNAGSPIASGRWAFGWTASGAGFETTDGGMTWTKEIDLPAPLAGTRSSDEPRER